MLSQKLNESKKPGVKEMVAGLFYNTVDEITKEQAGIAKTYYNKRSGDLISNLTGRNFDVMTFSSGVKLIIDYVKYIRFLDLKKTGRGYKKKNYHPIYNKPLYGYIYNFTYPKLRYGLAQTLRENTTAPLKALFKDPIEIGT
jgi:hypothetical protein